MDNGEIRKKIIQVAETQLGKPYKFGFQIANLDEESPAAFDCSEFTRWAHHQAGLFLPDGSYNQYEFCATTDDPKPGDLGFFKETEEKNLGGRKIGQIYHVGIFFDNLRVCEARGRPFDKVLFRPVVAWREYKNFGGWRVHPKLV